MTLRILAHVLLALGRYSLSMPISSSKRGPGRPGSSARWQSEVCTDRLNGPAPDRASYRSSLPSAIRMAIAGCCRRSRLVFLAELPARPRYASSTDHSLALQRAAKAQREREKRIWLAIRSGRIGTRVHGPRAIRRRPAAMNQTALEKLADQR